MGFATISVVLAIVSVLAVADKAPQGPQLHHKAPQGPQLHHVTGQSGYDTFGTQHAPAPVYGGPSHDVGVAHHGGGGYGHAQPVQYQTAYIPVHRPRPNHYMKVKSSPLKDLDKMIKDYGKKFSKFIFKGFKKGDKKGDDYYHEEPSYPVYQQQPHYHAPKPTYHAPQPTYHAPQPTYHAPQPTYHAPKPTYHAPQPTYHAPQPTYHAPQPTYHAPQPTYHAPQPTYHAPQPTYHAPQPVYHRSSYH